MADEDVVESDARVENDDSYRRNLMALFKNLRSQAISNAEFFQDGKSQNSERFHASFRRLYEHIDRGIEPGIECLLGVVHQFDLDPQTPANGYRSMIKVIHKCCLKILQLTRYVTVTRASFLFRSGHYSRELEAYVTTLGQLRACLYYIERLLGYSGGSELFPDEESLSAEDYATAERLMMEVETLCQETFYGRCLAFQYCESMARPLTTIVVAMASFADAHLTNSSMLKMASTILGSGKYIMDQELRAQQIVNVTRNGDIKFLKDFWSVAESDFLHQLPLYVCPQVFVDKVITIHPETFELKCTDGIGFVKITPPCAHSGPFPVQTRLISYKLRQGQERWFAKSPAEAPLPPSPCLVLHCHGGGFVAQSSASHQVYLRHWAKDLNVPILSVDYSLAPEFPFPRQLEEVFFAYCWALRNHAQLGWTGERVCFAGDSAGGNLIVSTTMRALALKVRPPDGLMLVYGVMLVRYCPSPSRIMALLDPLLSVGVMANCLAAYSGMSQSTLVSVPYYHGAQHSSASRTPTPLTHSASHLSMTRHKSTASGDSGFHDLIRSDSAPSVRGGSGGSRDAEQVIWEAATRGSNQQTAGGDTVAADGMALAEGERQAGGQKAEFCINSDEEEERVGEQMVSNSTCPSTDRREDPLGAGDTASPPTDERPRRSSMWLDLGGFFRRTPREKRPLLRSPSSPATLVSLEKATSKSTPGDERLTSVTARLCRLRLCRSVRFTLWLVTGDMLSHYLPCLQLHYRSPFAQMSYSLTEDDLKQNPPTYAQIRHFAQSPVVQFRHMPISRNPYMSPFLASDELLKDMPPCYFVACHLDPMLDDSVAMAKRLKNLGREVHLQVHDDLPHGFLNFVLLSPEAKRGSDAIVQQLRHILRLDVVDWDEFDVVTDEEVAQASRDMEDSFDQNADDTLTRDVDLTPVHRATALNQTGAATTGVRMAACAPCL